MKIWFLYSCSICLINYGTFQELICPEKNGRFATTQCDAYIECVNGIGGYKLCPDGLLFDEKAHLFGYPCGYPIDVDCKGRNVLQPPLSTEYCPRQFGYYRLGDASNCGQFMNCAFGEGYVFNCPNGLAFNERTYKCDWPDLVDTCDAESFLGFTCPVDSEDVSNNVLKLYPHPTDCQRYFLCLRGQPRMQSCGKKQAFNDVTEQCDSIANVTRCTGIVSSTSSIV